jgi:PhnB protein
MNSITTTPYLFFKGQCKEAMEFYQSIFGGELTLLKPADIGMRDSGMPEGYIMHAYLNGGEVTLMASDSQQASPVAKKVSISLNGEVGDEAKLRTIFDALSDGAKVQYPLKVEAWGDIFGAVVDKYGIDWMINISVKQAGK